jgi:uncharacterized NAD(P)/FAD-binding protein YdhS
MDAVTTTPQHPVVAVIGGGASGTLSAVHIALAAESGHRRIDVLLADPHPAGRGRAYATHDPRHRLNVAATGMSAFPDDPEHFLRWLRRHIDPTFPPTGFASRQHFGEYLEHVLDQTVTTCRSARIEIVRAPISDLRRHGRRWRLSLDDGSALAADAVVLAVGAGRPSYAWAPAELVRSPRFVADPWNRTAPATPRNSRHQVVLVGSSLTMADTAMTWGRDGTVLHTVSRHGLLPLSHAQVGPRPAPPEIAPGPLTFAALRHAVFAHVRKIVADGGDWRQAIDSLRPVSAELWQRLPVEDRATFLATAARRWNTVRHRVEPSIAAWVEERLADGSLQSHAASVVDAIETDDAIHLRLSDGRTLAADLVVNCTGPCTSVLSSDDPLMMNLLQSGLIQPHPTGLGIRCESDGRVISSGARGALWTIGALRQGELWESTAIPEIRVQAAEVASSVLASLPGAKVQRRPRDPYGLPLSTTSDAAARYNEGLGRILRVQSGAEELIADALRHDPGFALGHAALALLGAEWGVEVDVDTELDLARRHADGTDERESRFIDAVSARVVHPGSDSASTLITYVHDYPEDALAVSISVPTIAFGGATELPAEAWALVEGLAPAYRDDWWYRGLLAFIRQEQGDHDDAAHLADLALAVEPASGHAVHARTHVYYETGAHAAGLSWLDSWIRRCGRGASHRAHFSWHAALHELALGDDRAAARRYADQLAPPAVSGVRALVDSASLLWRGYTLGAWTAEGASEVLASVPSGLLTEPSTPFIGMHAAIALAAAGDCHGLAGLRRWFRRQSDPAFTGTLAGLADALGDLVHGDADLATDTLLELGDLVGLGGSAAQREVVEDTLLFSATRAGRHEVASALLTERLARRASPRDLARCHDLTGGTGQSAETH